MKLSNFLYIPLFDESFNLQVLEAVKGQSKPVAAPELLGCMKILMVAIKRFLPLVLATRDKDGWLWSAWVANEQTQVIIDSKKEVSRLCCSFIPETSTFSNESIFFTCFHLRLTLQTRLSKQRHSDIPSRLTFINYDILVL